MRGSLCQVHATINELIMSDDNFIRFHLRPAPPPPPPSTSASSSSSIAPAGRAGCGLSEEERGMVQRFEPGGALDTNGFFLAAFRKRE